MLTEDMEDFIGKKEIYTAHDTRKEEGSLERNQIHIYTEDKEGVEGTGREDTQLTVQAGQEGTEGEGNTAPSHSQPNTIIAVHEAGNTIFFILYVSHGRQNTTHSLHSFPPFYNYFFREGRGEASEELDLNTL